MKIYLGFMLLAIAGITWFTGCADRPDAPLAKTGEAEAFDDFYRKFMQDSTFQLSRIQFPLEGLPNGADSAVLAANNFKWQQEDWKIHQPFGEESGFVQQFSTVGDNMVIENIVHQSKQYAMVRRFARLGDEWYLIYYAGLNTLRK